MADTSDRSLPGLVLDLFRASLSSRISRLSGRSRSRRRLSGRAFAAGGSNPLTEGWNPIQVSTNEDIRRALVNLRARSRDLAHSNDYARRFLALVKANVVGPEGIRLEVKPKNPDGTIDKTAGDILESAFRRWGRRGSCEVSGQLPWTELQRTAIETVARDGEIFVRLLTGAQAGNREGFALQLIDPAACPVHAEQDLGRGRRLYMGVELDELDRRLAYHFSDPTNYNGPTTRVPADEILHLYVPAFLGQLRGVPWAHTAAIRLQQLGAYEDAEVVAARLGAAKMGFLYEEGGEEYTGDEEGDDGELVEEATPGTITRLPNGVKFQSWDPDHPSGTFEAFTKRILKGAASGLGVSYPTWANDLEGVNYSSLRQGALDDRDQWRVFQNWLVDSLPRPVWDRWLPRALVAQTAKLPLSKISKFDAATWIPRRWQWVDPLKDIQARVLALRYGLTSRRRILSEVGDEFEDIVQELAAEQAALENVDVASLGAATAPRTGG